MTKEMYEMQLVILKQNYESQKEQLLMLFASNAIANAPYRVGDSMTVRRGFVLKVTKIVFDYYHLGVYYVGEGIYHNGKVNENVSGLPLYDNSNEDVNYKKPAGTPYDYTMFPS